LQYTIAAVNIFADADPNVLEESYRTLHLCTYLSTNGIWIVDAKWIIDVIRMVPFKYTQQETNYSEGKQYFMVEKLSAGLIWKGDTDSSNKGE
jgi:hypothetical protein